MMEKSLSHRAEALTRVIADLVPGAGLNWLPVPQTRLVGFLIDEVAATEPLPADKVGAVMEAPPFWSLLWPAGCRLCGMLETVSMRGRSCVDLGCGSGLVGVAAARAGAGSVVAADSDPVALEAARVNGMKNGVELFLETRWVSQSCSTLFLADFLYDETNLTALRAYCEVAEEVVVLDSRLKDLPLEEFRFVGSCLGRAVPDLDPHREFGSLRFWYFGSRFRLWEKAFYRENCSRR